MFVLPQEDCSIKEVHVTKPTLQKLGPLFRRQLSPPGVVRMIRWDDIREVLKASSLHLTANANLYYVIKFPLY